MKRIEAIIRPAKVNEVYKALEEVGHPGLMISEIEGHGVEKGIEQQVRGKMYKVDLITKARIELVVEDEEVERIVSAIQKAAFTGKIGDGKIFVHPVDNAVRLGTAERGDAAIR
ncbi:MAG: P-II family nitrogen regulator [Spirochaetia bacterium]|jgi:nitrogen regulatory protein P-II 1